MPRPIALASGVYRLNVRLPSDLATKLRGGRIHLPFDGKVHSVVATDKVAVSLRTKDPAVAKARFVEAYGALVRHFESVRAGPQPITHKQAVALAGEVYRRRAERLENDPAVTPATAAAAIRAADLNLAEWRYGTCEAGDDGEIPIETARLLAAIQRPSGVELLAWEAQADVDTPFASVTLDDALQHLFGADVDGICAEKALMLDEDGRRLLLREIGKAVHDAANKLARNLDGDYADDPAAGRFPEFHAAPSVPHHATATTGRGGARQETVARLFERWAAYHATRRSPATIRRYGPSLERDDFRFGCSLR